MNDLIKRIKITIVDQALKSSAGVCLKESFNVWCFMVVFCFQASSEKLIFRTCALKHTWIGRLVSDGENDDLFSIYSFEQ